MTANFDSTPPNGVLHSVGVNDNVTIHSNLSEHSQTAVQNASSPNDCITVVFSETGYLPLDNSDNIASAEVETIARRIKNNMLVLLFLIGGPANVVNMVVFYKQGLQDRVNLCLFALSFADEMFLISAMFSYGEQLHIQLTRKESFGTILTFLTNNNLLVFFGFSYVSPILSALIATERCLCVLSPIKFQSLLRTRTTAAVIAVVHVLVFSLYFIVLFRYRIGCVYDPVSDVTEMMVIEGEFYRAHKELINILDGFVLSTGLLGAVIIVVMTTTITIVKLRQIVTWRTEASSSLSPPEVALTKMLVANSIFFIICVFPDAVNRVTWLFLSEMNFGRRHQKLYLTTLWIMDILFFTNATFNIFLYYIMGSRYRATFWALFGRTLHLEKQQPNITENEMSTKKNVITRKKY